MTGASSQVPADPRATDAAAERVFHNIVQVFGYYAWIAKIAPSLDRGAENTSQRLYFTLAQNAVVDGYLINLRRLNEFFSPPKKNEFDDDLRAHHFGFPEVGGFLTKEEMDELHKRIAHSTTRTATQGDASYEVFKATELALKHSFQFLEFLIRDFYKGKNEKLLTACVPVLALWTSWCNDVANEGKAKAAEPNKS